MLIGPVFTREVVTVPRRMRLYVSRTAYVVTLGVLMWTAWLILAGTQNVENVGDLARFGATLFQILAALQITLAVFFSALLAASAVAQEKDRRTLVLLLLTNLSNSELVLGRLMASLLGVLAMLAAGLPFFMLTVLFGGVSFDQVARVFAVTLCTILAAGSLGSTIALWREKTFQTLAMTLLLLVFWLAAWEIVGAGLLGSEWSGMSTKTWAEAFSPWQAILVATRPSVQVDPAQVDSVLAAIGGPINLFLLVMVGIALVLDGLAIALVRVWNPSREARPRKQEEAASRSIWSTEQAELDAKSKQRTGPTSVAKPSVHSAPGKTRHVWDNPILWREIRTWAYGRKVVVIQVAYLVLFAVAAVLLEGIVSSDETGARAIIPRVAIPLVPLFVVGLVLINARAVTSLTTERDGQALDLLLVTDLTPKEFIFGKLGGVFYNTKEIIILPMLLCIYLWTIGGITGENLIFLLGGLLVMIGFVAMLGIHAGISYENSRSAIGVSLGTFLFLCIGIATCMRMMIAFSSSFNVQYLPFLAFMFGGGVGLFIALGSRNPSTAICLASFSAPIATFIVITNFILDKPLAVFVLTTATYGFATAAMLIPAIYEFDVATGRTSADE